MPVTVVLLGSNKRFHIVRGASYRRALFHGAHEHYFSIIYYYSKNNEVITKRLAQNAVDFFESGFAGNDFEDAILAHGMHATAHSGGFDFLSGQHIGMGF